MGRMKAVATIMLPYNPANYCTCGHSHAQHRMTKGITLKNGKVIAAHEYCHVSMCRCSGFEPKKK